MQAEQYPGAARRTGNQHVQRERRFASRRGIAEPEQGRLHTTHALRSRFLYPLQAVCSAAAAAGPRESKVVESLYYGGLLRGGCRDGLT